MSLEQIKQEKESKLFLPLNLQFFADGGEGGEGGNGEGGQGQGQGEGGNGEGGNGGERGEGTEKTFTQAELEAIIADRLKREKRKAEEKAEEARKEAERKALEEQGKYKEMYEQLQKDLEAQKANALKVKKETALIKAGYTDEQVERYVKYLDGDTDEDIKTAVEQLIADIPPQTNNGVDPQTLGNGKKKEQTQEQPYDYGKSVFARLKGKKK